MVSKFYELLLKIRIDKIKKKVNKLGRNSYFGKSGIIIGGENITIGSNFSIGNNYKIQAWTHYNEKKIFEKPPQIIIGNNVSAMDNVQISCCRNIILGDGCLLGDNVFITDNMHGMINIKEIDIPPVKRNLYSKGAVTIGRNVWIGRNVCIFPGVTIGDGVVIGANAVVTKDIKNNSVVGGIPAKFIREM